MRALDDSVLDSYAARGIAERWKQYIELKIDDLGPEWAAEYFFSYWENHIGYGDPFTNDEIIAVLHLYLRSEIRVPTRLRAVAITAICCELEAGFLALWNESERARREVALRGLLERLGVPLETPKQSLDMRRPRSREPLLAYRSLSAATTHLMNATLKAKRRRERTQSAHVAAWPKSLTPFLGLLDRLMKHRIGDKDEVVFSQAVIERCMMMGFYLAMGVGMSFAELEEMLRRLAAVKDKF